MAGALTANAVTTRVLPGDALDTETAIGDIALLSPVDGANNVLLTGIVILESFDSESTVTFQWYRCAPGATVDADVLGDAVGDPFDLEQIEDGETLPVTCVQAIDRGPGLTSAYALTAVASGDGEAVTSLVYVDAVLYD